MRHRWLRGPHTYSSAALTKRAVAAKALMQGGIPQPQRPLVGCDTPWISDGPVLLGECTEDTLFALQTGRKMAS